METLTSKLIAKLSSQMIQCCICKEEFDNNHKRPLINIDCQHTFCKKCILDIQRNTPFPKCPLCQKKLDNVQNNYIVDEVLERLQQALELCDIKGTKILDLSKVKEELTKQIKIWQSMYENQRIKNQGLIAEKIKQQAEYRKLQIDLDIKTRALEFIIHQKNCKIQQLQSRLKVQNKDIVLKQSSDTNNAMNSQRNSLQKLPRSKSIQNLKINFTYRNPMPLKSKEVQKMNITLNQESKQSLSKEPLNKTLKTQTAHRNQFPTTIVNRKRIFEKRL